MNSLSLTDLHRLKWLMGQLLVLIAFWAMLELDVGSQPLLLLFGFVVFCTVLFPGVPSRIPAVFWKAATPAVITIILLDFFIHGADFLQPLVRMIMLLAVYRSMQYRSRREDLQLVLLSLFILVITGVMTVSLTFGFQMLLFTPLAMGMLFVINLLEASHRRILNRSDWEGFRWRSFLRRLRQGLDLRLLGFAGVLFAGMVTVSTMIFLAMPRFSIDQALPFLQMPGTSTTGFSDSIRYGEVSSLQDDNSIALRVDAPEGAKIPGDPYWRMIVLDEYTDQGFRMSAELKRNHADLGEGVLLNARYWDREGELEPSEPWLFYMHGNVSQYLPLLGPFDTVRFQKVTKTRAYPGLNLLSMEMVSANLFGYSVSGMRNESRLEATSVERMALVQHSPIPQPPMDYENPRFIQYPHTTRIVPAAEHDREYLEQIVEEITGGEQLDAEAFSLKASNWLRQNYRYGRNVDMYYDPMGDPLLLWMREEDEGWCEHFSGAFTLLARTAGFPARLISGFAGAERNDYDDYLVIRNKNAHAWVEIYDLKGHWLRVDPTPSAGSASFGEMAAASTSLVVTFSGWSAWTDSLRMMWYRRVVNFDETDQAEMASDIRSYASSSYEEVKSRLKGWLEEAKAWVTEGWNRQKVMTLALYLAIVCFSLLAVRYLYLGLREVMRHRGSLFGIRAGDPIRLKAGHLLQRFQPLFDHAREHLAGQERLAWQEARLGLLELRFGQTSSRAHARQVMRQARRLMRRYKPEKA